MTTDILITDRLATDLLTTDRLATDRLATEPLTTVHLATDLLTNDLSTTDRLATVYGTLLGAIVYGLCLFHFVVHPMALRIERHARETYEKNVFLLMIVALLVRKKSTLELFESVNLLLPEGHKLNWTELSPDHTQPIPEPSQKTA